MPEFTDPVTVEEGHALVSAGYSDVVGSHTQNSSMSSAVSITVPAGAGQWMVGALTQNVRFTLDGTTPTASKGFQIKAGEPFLLVSVTPGNTIKVIEETATAVLDYQFLS